MNKIIFLFLFLTFSYNTFAASRMIISPADTGAYTEKADDGLWVTVREVPFDIAQTSTVSVHAGLTVDGSSTAIGGSKMIGGMFRITINGRTGGNFAYDVFEFGFSIAGNAGGTFRAPYIGYTAAPALAPGSYVAKVEAWASRAGANRYNYKFKAAKTTVEIHN